MPSPRTVVAQEDATDRNRLRRPFVAAVLAVGGGLLLLWASAQGGGDATLAPSSDEAPVERALLVPDREGGRELAELARAVESKRALEQNEALPAEGDRLSVRRGTPPLVDEVVEESDVAELGAEGAEEVGGAQRARAADLQLVEEHERRMRQRALQQHEESRFRKSLRAEAFEEEAMRGGPRALSRAADPEAAEEEQLGALQSLQTSLLRQSAAQVGGRQQELGGALGALRGLTAPAIGGTGEGSDFGRGEQQKADFFRRGGEQLPPGVLLATVQAPPSPYLLNMGAVIPGVLVTHINSESPGQVLGRVSEHVFDSATGDHLLIPQGAPVVLTYSAMITLGQERVQVASVRLNFPNGATLDLGGMSVADATGQAGLSDLVNTHVWKRIGAALLTTAATVGYEVTAPKTPFGFEGSVHRGLGESIMKMANDMAQRDAQIPPTLEIRPGKRFVIHVNRDVVFPGPYEDGYARRPREVRGSSSRKERSSSGFRASGQES